MANEGMNTLGWVAIIGGVVVIRFAARGRGLTQIPGDISDLTIAAISGGNVREVLDRRGEAEPITNAAAIANPSGGSVLKTALQLGGSAKGYRLGATGPDFYDCSGLVWQALRMNGYNGPRFATANFPPASGFTKVDQPVTGDIALWRPNPRTGGHMGIVTDPNNVYSALSPESGIKTLSIDSLNKSKGYNASYWRWDGK